MLNDTALMTVRGRSEVDVETGSARIRGLRLGVGPPILLLHGFPQTHVAWHRVWPLLSQHRTVVACDLRGYGDSVAHDGDFTFREMAADQVAVMHRLGFESFAVVGHDRGGRVAHRMALDYPQAVDSVVLLDILPTRTVWSDMDAVLARAYWHWSFLSQPAGLPERALAADPLAFLHTLLGPAIASGAVSAEALAHYERAALRPSVQRAFCADYRAAATTDLEHDEVGAQSSSVPALVLWGTRGVVGRRDPVASWREVFSDVRGSPVEAGHFLPEEVPGVVAAAVLDFHRGA